MKVYTLESAKAKFAEAKDVWHENGIKTLVTPRAAINMASLGVEAISILILAIIFVLAPTIGSAISKSMPADVDVNWTKGGTGADLWATLAPMIQVAAIVLIAAIVIKAIYDFKTNSQ